MTLRMLLRRSCPEWCSVLLALSFGVFAESAAGQSEFASEPTGPPVVAKVPESGRLPNGLWPAGTPIQVILGIPSDPMPVMADPVGVGPGLDLLRSTDPTNGARPTEIGDVAEGRSAEGGRWSLVPPPWRAFHSAAYDAVRRRMVVFGGTDGMERNDVWTFSLERHSRWRLMSIRGQGPKPRGHAAIVYDPHRDRMLIFGGSNSPGVAGGAPYNDAWELSLRGQPTWRQILPTGVGPSPRRGASAIYDPIGDQMVIFGGLTRDDRWNGETWVLALKEGGAWTRLDAPGTSPLPRWAHSAVYDPMRQRMVVFGGNGVAGYSTNDAYALSLGAAPAWTSLDGAGDLPPRRFRHSAIYNPVRDQMVIFGGEAGAFPFSDTWALSLGGVPMWSRLDVAPTDRVRAGHVGVYDAANDRMVVHGGGFLNETWALSLATLNWNRLDSPFGMPPHRAGHSAIYDPARNRMITYGTYYGVGDADFDDYGGAWALSLGPQLEWRPFAWPGRPVLVWNHPAFYDPVEDRVIVLRGRRQDMSEVWQLSLGDESWRALIPAGPIPEVRGFITGVFDPVRRRIVVFGLGVAGRETWALELEGGPRWEALLAATPPPARDEPMSIYDSARQRMILFGGRSSTFELYNDSWALSLRDALEWTQLTPSGIAPQGRMGGSAIYDPLSDRMIVYGGWPLSHPADAVWALSFGRGEGWRRLAPFGFQPIARSAHVSVYDPRKKSMVISGGSGVGLLSDTWLLDLGGRASTEAEEEDGVAQDRTGDLPGVVAMNSAASAAGAVSSLGFSVRSQLGPFTRSMRIELLLSGPRAVRVSVYDTQGREVRELVRENLDVGRRIIDWDGRDATGRALPSGLYFLRVYAGDASLVRRALLVW